MKRLTIRTNEASISFECESVGDIVRRLAAIEDILGEEYELEQIKGIFDEWHHYLKFASERNAIEEAVSDIYDNGNVDWNRLRELVEADREGRCVVLPCKVGQRVKVDVHTWGSIWNYKTVDHGKFLIGEIVAIVKTKKQTLLKIRVEHNVSWKRPTKRYPASAIGKTVF